MFVDSHCHLYSEYYDNINEIINLSKKDKICYFINAGCDKKSNLEVITLINNKDIFGVIGYHPEYADIITKQDLILLEEQIKTNNIIGIGEIGLDFHYDNYDKEKQIKLFNYQLNIAEKYNLPVVIHSREATKETIDILKKYNVKGIIHSFSGSKEIAEIYIKMGFILGINGTITFKNCKLINTLKEIGIKNIAFETDCPYLTPVPLRGKKNYPGNIKYIIEFISENLNITIEDLSKITNDNINRIFNINI
ncbi:MAG: TatD family hydrolase [Bacilli bacterium]